jgi:2-polyprenyl-3-methyl-5-hydroxy-6-metoxy-1,4-benzoquinol methylase
MPWMCSTEKDLKERVNNLDRMFESIKENGFTTSPDEMIDVYSYKDNLSKQSLKNHEFLDYILIDVSRTGEPLFVDGGHRLMMAKMLEIKEVPVIVRIRHKEWADFRQELKEYAKAHGGYLYQKVPHFDLATIPYGHDESRIEIIKEATALKSGSVLDIGAYLGLHCYELEKKGFKCTAVETNPVRTYFTKKIRDANKQSFEVVTASILTFKKEESLNYDMVLALNIFHHFLKDEKTHHDLVELLGRIECQEMFFEAHNHKEDQMKGSYVNYSGDEFVNFILENSSLDSSHLLREFDSGRKLYKLYKQ